MAGRNFNRGDLARQLAGFVSASQSRGATRQETIDRAKAKFGGIQTKTLNAALDYYAEKKNAANNINAKGSRDTTKLPNNPSKTGNHTVNRVTVEFNLNIPGHNIDGKRSYTVDVDAAGNKRSLIERIRDKIVEDVVSDYIARAGGEKNLRRAITGLTITEIEDV